ncbi:MAG TPA: tautomerase family protein [Polyangiales bacterium]|nr:tautomerase family protein [Polyangiales bacterium]
MPFVRISVVEGGASRFKAQISEAVHTALVEKFNVPSDDRFQAISVHGPDELIYPPAYLGIVHSKSIVIIQVTCNAGRTLELKKALYARIAELIASTTEVGKNDVIISLVEVQKEDWSFGNGAASYA